MLSIPLAAIAPSPKSIAYTNSARRHKAQVIVGAGGGNVLDTARAAAEGLNLPVVNCPTVASSDAPCSALSVIYTEEGVFQEYRFYRKNPDLVLVDTQVIAQFRPACWLPAWAMLWLPGLRPRPALQAMFPRRARRSFDAECSGIGEALL